VGIELDGQPRAAAFVIAEPGATPEALLAPLRAALAPFKVPARLWLVDEFPTAASANGFKIQRARLRQMAEERLQQETPAWRPARPARTAMSSHSLYFEDFHAGQAFESGARTITEADLTIFSMLSGDWNPIH